MIGLNYNHNSNPELRLQKQIIRLRNRCPHVMLRLEGDTIMLRSYFESPPGTIAYICAQCGLVVNQMLAEDITQSWATRYQNLMDLKKAIDKAQKRYVRAVKRCRLA